MKNWVTKKLGELSKKKDAVVSGPFGSNLKVSDYKTEGIPILRLQNIGKGYFIDKDIKYISEEKAEELKYHSFISGDITLAKLGIPIGKTCIIPNHLKSGIITADIVRIRPDKNVVNFNFLEYFLNTDLSVSQLTGNISGATRPRVNLSDVRDIEIPLPPLPEQKRIVSILDECFAAIAKAKANAEQNLKNTKELFESYLQGVFEKNEKYYETKSIGEVCEIIDSLHKTPKYIEEGGFPMVRVTEIKRGNLDITKALRVDEETYKEFSKKHIPKVGDIVFSRVGASFGVSSIVTSDEPFCLGQNTAFIIPKLDSLYCYYFLNSQVARNQMNELVAGAAQPTISLKSIKELNIPMPSLKGQQTIVRQLDTLRAETQKLEAVYQKKIDDLEELKKSILQKAFAGELTDKEIDLN